MHAKSRETVKKYLTEFFQSTKSADAIPLNVSVARAANEIHKLKKQYIDQTEIQIVIGDFIKDALNKKSSTLTDSINHFGEMFEATELGKLIDEIIDYFISLPRNYLCVFKLPNIISPRQFSVSINENISLDFTERKKTTAGLLNALLDSLGSDEYFLTITIKCSGYLSIVDYGAPYGIFKHIVGIAVAFDYFESNPLRFAISQRGLFGTNPVHFDVGSYFIDEVLGESSKINMHFSDNVNERLYDLEFNKKTANDNYEEIINHIKNVYLSFKNDEIHAGRIRSAFEWSYDSKFTNNTTFTFILNCIAIEALMGDSGTMIGKTVSANLTTLYSSKFF